MITIFWTRLNSISGILMVLCTIIAIMNVILRYVFNSPLTWGEEINVILLAWFVFLPQGGLEATDKHLRLTILTDRIGQTGRTILYYVRLGITLVIVFYLAYHSYNLAVSNFVANSHTMVLDIPLWIVYSIMPVAFFLSAAGRSLDLLVRRWGDKNW